MKKTIAMQPIVRSQLDKSRLYSFAPEVISAPTAPLIHSNSRFLLIRGGRGSLQLQGKSYELHRGDLVAILPWQISQITAVEEPLQYALMAYHFDTVCRAARLFHGEGNTPLPIEARMEQMPVVHLSTEALADAEYIARSLQRELGTESAAESDGAYSGVAVTSLLVNLMVLFLRSSGMECGVHTEKDTPNEREILRYMYLHCSEKLTLQQLSDIFYCSKSTISSRIQEMTGLSFFDLLNEIRVGKTANYLLYTDLTIKELAEILGYVDESHISKVFAARLGTRLSEYRNTYRKVENICQIEESRLGYSVTNYVYRNYASDLQAGDVARHFGVSVEKLNQVLLYQTERGFDDFLSLVRVNRACELLTETKRGILEIALEVGFHNQKTFARNFLKHRLMTPSAYRSAGQRTT